MSIVSTPYVARKYAYTVRNYDLINGKIRHNPPNQQLDFFAVELELQTVNHWWIFESSTYHDSFFNDWVDPDKAVPTQVCGAIGETLALLTMEKIHGARLIQKITPFPSSKTADFWMEMDAPTGNVEDILVESKGTNSLMKRPDKATVDKASSQLSGSRAVMVHDGYPVQHGFAVISAYKTNRVFVVKVF
jgi:hypothetical protein